MLTRIPPPAGDVGTVLRNQRGSGPQDFRDRFAVRGRGAEAFGLQVPGDGRLPARVLLPWPVG
jgi:hypothetical protein